MTHARPSVPPCDAPVAEIGALLARGYLRLLLARQKGLDEQPVNEALWVSPVRTDGTPDTSEDPEANFECRREHALAGRRVGLSRPAPEEMP
jgi:hypothetical protein